MYDFYNAGIQGKANQDWEVLLKCFATAYDSHNPVMLTSTPGKFNPTTLNEIKTRFADLKRLSRKYCPEKLRTVESIERMALENHTGKLSDRVYLNKLRFTAASNGANIPMLDQMEMQINAAEGQGHRPRSNSSNIPEFFKLGKPRERRKGKYERTQKPPDPAALIKQMFGFGKRGGR